MSTQKRKRQSISVELKKKIIDEKDAHPSKSYPNLAKQFTTDKIKLSEDNIKRIFRDKDKILAAINEGAGAKRKRLTTGRNVELEAAVLTWFQQVRSQNVAVSGPLLKVKLVAFLKLTLYSRKSAPITGPAARQACTQLRQYFEENGLDASLFPAFDRIEDLLLEDQLSKMKQPTIHDFFTPK